jgi:hypothetical protein
VFEMGAEISALGAEPEELADVDLADANVLYFCANDSQVINPQ